LFDTKRRGAAQKNSPQAISLDLSFERHTAVAQLRCVCVSVSKPDAAVLVLLYVPVLMCKKRSDGWSVLNRAQFTLAAVAPLN
jgi:hypothetical protein